MMAAHLPPNLPEPLRPFSAQQERIADLLADGHSAPAIADELGLSYHTICGHIRVMALILPGDEPAQAKIREFVWGRRRALREAT